MIIDGKGFSEDGLPNKRERRHKDTRGDTMYTGEKIRFKGCFINTENKKWKNITE